jgi:hypothetical protein
MVRTFADQAVIAIENARLLAELQARTDELTRSVAELQALEEVLRAVNSLLDLDTVLATIISRTAQLSEADQGTIYEFDQSEEVFVPKSAFGMGAERMPTLRERRVRLGETHLGRAAVERAPVHVEDVQQGPSARLLEGCPKFVACQRHAPCSVVDWMRNARARKKKRVRWAERETLPAEQPHGNDRAGSRGESAPQRTRNRLGRRVLGLAIPMLAGCAATAVHISDGPTLLTAAEMIRVTVGASGASAVSQVAAFALPPEAQVTGSADTLAASSIGMDTGSPFLAYLSPNYSGALATVSSTSGRLAETSSSSQVFVSSSNSWAWVDAEGTTIASGGEAGHAQTSLQFDGFSIGRVNFAFGTAVAAACCAPRLGAQATADGGGGPYFEKIAGYSQYAIPGQVQTRVDIAVAASALPLVDQGQMMKPAGLH